MLATDRDRIVKDLILHTVESLSKWVARNFFKHSPRGGRDCTSWRIVQILNYLLEVEQQYILLWRGAVSVYS